MSGVDTLLACVFALIIAYVSAWAICCGAVPIIRDHLKAFFNWPFDAADRLVRREVSAALEPEPDWALAAEETGFLDPIPEPLWRDLDNLWTPAEREAFDLNSNQRFIDETDAVLNGLEWERFTAEIDDPALQRAIRRNGAQL